MLHTPDKLLLLAGPCALENASTCHAVASVLATLRERHRNELNIIFKGSFDKANRTSHTSARGPGLEQGMKLLAAVKREYAFPVVTDVHTPEQCARVAQTADVLQIPAFLCRQTDLLAAAAQTHRTVNVKKGQFLSPYEMAHVTAKLSENGATEIWQTERGTTFGYQNLVVDMRAFPIMARNEHPVLMDATHSVQLPGAANGASGGQREYIATLAKAAIAAGADGLFMETHPDPEKAISDGPSQIPLSEFPDLVESCLRIWRAVRT